MTRSTTGVLLRVVAGLIVLLGTTVSWWCYRSGYGSVAIAIEGSVGYFAGGLRWLG